MLQSCNSQKWTYVKLAQKASMLRKSGGIRRQVLKPAQGKQIVNVFTKKIDTDPAESGIEFDFCSIISILNDSYFART